MQSNNCWAFSNRHRLTKSWRSSAVATAHWNGPLIFLKITKTPLHGEADKQVVRGRCTLLCWLFIFLGMSCCSSISKNIRRTTYKKRVGLLLCISSSKKIRYCASKTESVCSPVSNSSLGFSLWLIPELLKPRRSGSNRESQPKTSKRISF